jgi:tripartite-type tricarboxylate transporter receptor subunit TctC
VTERVSCIGISLRRGAMHAAVALWAGTTVATGLCAEVAFPAKPVQLVLPFSAGTQVDVAMRALAEPLSRALGQPVLVVNRAGASGNIAADFVAKSAPDGHTLFVAGVTQTIQPNLPGSTAADPSRAFVAVIKLATQPILIAVNPSIGVDSLSDLIALARREPGKIAYSTGGVGSTGHLAAEMLSSAAHIELLHVPYPSANLVMRDVVSGLVPLTFNPLSATTPYIRDKRLTALAVTGSRRVQRFPEIPTVAELGFPGFDVSSWYGIVAPLGTSPEIVDRLHREFVAVLALPEVRARLVEMGMEIVGNTPGQFAVEIKADVARWAPIVEAIGLRSEAKP